MERYYQDLGLIDAIDNYALGGLDCYEGMPTGYVPPPDRRQPDPNRNITKAVNAIPKPDIVLVNFPSNNYGIMSDEEIIFCLDSIKKYANERGVKCYITTSQPRDDWWQFPTGLCRLREIRDIILNHFGEFAIDFYTDVATADCKIKPEFALGDLIHLNPAGHTVLTDKVIEKNILHDVVALNFTEFRAAARGPDVMLSWRVESDQSTGDFMVTRSGNGQSFKEIARVACQGAGAYSFRDRSVPGGKYFYRIEAKEISGRINYSKTLAVQLGTASLHVGAAVVRGSQLQVEVSQASAQPVRFILVNASGQILFAREMRLSHGTFREDLHNLPTGVYTLMVNAGSETVRQMVMVRK